MFYAKNKTYIPRFVVYAKLSEHKIPFIYSFMMISNMIIVTGIQVFSTVNTAPFKSLIYSLFTQFQTT